MEHVDLWIGHPFVPQGVIADVGNITYLCGPFNDLYQWGALWNTSTWLHTVHSLHIHKEVCCLFANGKMSGC